MKKILMLATGGTIASMESGQGLTPGLPFRGSWHGEAVTDEAFRAAKHAKQTRAAMPV